MDLTLLPPILLALAEQRSLDAVLSTIVNAVITQPHVALARVWLREEDRSCPTCADHARGSDAALHLRASAGHPLAASADWSRVDGTFHRVALESDLKLSHVVRAGEPVRIDRLSEDSRWIRFPDWAREERLIGFAGRPLVCRGDVLGVLAVFRRAEIDDACWSWLRTFSDAAAIAVANARAFEAADARRQELEFERDYLRDELRDAGEFGEILGRSTALTRVLREVETVAGTDGSVLILGESGTGKELIARAIHQRSRRAAQALVKVNCGSIPRDLFESEFFGHVRGSFTGAVRDRVGRFHLADRGTLFLDEVGEIPPDLQVKLLRVLQEGEFERVGEDRTRRVDVRIVAATNRDLQADVSANRFRLDLYYRLGVFPIAIPPLRARRDDIPELIGHFVRRCCARLHVDAPRVPAREIARAQEYDWPGNIRELQNVVERAVILARGGAIELPLPDAPTAAGLEMPAPSNVVSGFSRTSALEDLDAGDVIPEREWRERERTNVLRALAKAQFRLYGPGGAADLLGINPATLASRLKKLGIRPRDFKAAGHP